MWGRASSAPRDNSPGRGARLTERRRRRRRRGVALFLGLIFLLAVGAVYGLRQDAVRISLVAASGDERLAEYARSAMQGNYFGIIPRDSIFFFPAGRIRSAILADYPDIAAVSIARNGLTAISITPVKRAAVARWCGLAPTPDVEEYCYVFDANGFVFAASATTTETLNPFALYAPLEGETLEPLRATLAHAERIPTIFDFARQLGARGSPVARVVIRGDEVDAALLSGTRVTYVLGNEQNAFAALVSADENFNLADGSVDYVDLRFDGKVYVKRKE